MGWDVNVHVKLQKQLMLRTRGVGWEGGWGGLLTFMRSCGVAHQEGDARRKRSRIVLHTTGEQLRKMSDRALYQHLVSTGHLSKLNDKVCLWCQQKSLGKRTVKRFLTCCRRLRLRPADADGGNAMLGIIFFCTPLLCCPQVH